MDERTRRAIDVTRRDMSEQWAIQAAPDPAPAPVAPEGLCVACSRGDHDLCANQLPCTCYSRGHAAPVAQDSPDPLRAAWDAVVAVLPDDGYIVNLHSMLDGTYATGAHSARDGYPKPSFLGAGATPEAALGDLRAAIEGVSRDH